jgi:hypothetical protein
MEREEILQWKEKRFMPVVLTGLPFDHPVFIGRERSSGSGRNKYAFNR